MAFLGMRQTGFMEPESKDGQRRKNLAVVMPVTGENAFYVDQPSIGAMHGQFIGEELVEITRKMFPLSRKKEKTPLSEALSMGGFGALRNGMKYHDTFGAVICLSGALHVLENPERAERTALHMKKVISEIWSKQQRVTKTRLFLSSS